MTLRGYLFDLDGTLIDSLALILECFRCTQRLHGRPPLTDLEYLGGASLAAVFACMTDDPDEVEAMVETYRRVNLERHDAAVRAFDGIGALLATLSERGARIGVVTNKRRELAWRGLRVCGLDGFVEALVGFDDVTRAKPHPESVERALAALGLTAADAVFIGDTPHDVTAGKAAGLMTAGAFWGTSDPSALRAAGPAHVLAHPVEVLGLS